MILTAQSRLTEYLKCLQLDEIDKSSRQNFTHRVREKKTYPFNGIMCDFSSAHSPRPNNLSCIKTCFALSISPCPFNMSSPLHFHVCISRAFNQTKSVHEILPSFSMNSLCVCMWCLPSSRYSLYRGDFQLHRSFALLRSDRFNDCRLHSKFCSVRDRPRYTTHCQCSKLCAHTALVATSVRTQKKRHTSIVCMYTIMIITKATKKYSNELRID